MVHKIKSSNYETEPELKQELKISSFFNFSNQIYSLFNGEKTDGYDCGDEIGDALTRYLKVEGKRSVRLLCFLEGLYTERDKASNPLYWHNNPVPKVNDKVIIVFSFFLNQKSNAFFMIAYMDLAGYMAFSKGWILAPVHGFGPVLQQALNKNF